MKKKTNCKISLTFMVPNEFQWLFLCSNILISIVFDRFLSANNCLTVLVGSLAHSISVSCVRIVKFVNDQLGHQQQDMTYNLHKSALQLIEKVCI